MHHASKGEAAFPQDSLRFRRPLRCAPADALLDLRQLGQSLLHFRPRVFGIL